MALLDRIVFDQSWPMARGHMVKGTAYLCDHHVAVERPSTIDLRGRIDMSSKLSHHRGTKGQIGHEMT